MHVGSWTVEDLLALPEDNQRHELLDGSLLVTPWPDVPHQRAASLLMHALHGAAPQRFEVLCSINVQLGGKQLFIPDVVVTTVPGADDTVLAAGKVALVAEVVSPSSVSMDRLLKPELYAAAGIPHFLRVELDGAGGPEITAYTMDGGGYREVASARAGEPLRLAEPFPVSVDPASLVATRS